MKIFGISFMTRRELKEQIIDLQYEIEDMLESFPFYLGQTVFDIALKNNKGRYARTNPSFEYSTITQVIVDKKNYFKLVDRYKRNDVFVNREAAEEYLKSICKE